MGSGAAVTDAKSPAVGELAGRSLGTRTLEFDERAAILYALAVGASAEDLELVYEQRLRVLPTFALTLGLWAVEEAGATGAYDPIGTLHVGQELTMREALPRSGAIEVEGAIDAVWDKGKAAVLKVTARSDAFEAVYAIMVPGAGGFGGERGVSGGDEHPGGDADLEFSVGTGVDQAALYRLTGDRHALHIDPEVAAGAGFKRPILHGLCTLATVARALAMESGAAPWDLSELSARFTAPAYPGATLEVRGWRGPEGISFETATGGEPVLSSGRVAFDGSAS